MLEIASSELPVSPDSARPRFASSAAMLSQRSSVVGILLSVSGQDGSAVLDVRSIREWEGWLDANHADAVGGVWLRLFKQGTSESSLNYAQAVESALCFGWIDGQKRKHDEVSWIQRFTPRRPGSGWSKTNIDRVERLVAEGRMRPSGLREVEDAKQDGRWARAYDPPSTAAVPDDLRRELQRNEKASAFFATLDKRNIYSVVYRLQTAKTAATRAKRLQAMIDMFERGEKFHD